MSRRSDFPSNVSRPVTQPSYGDANQPVYQDNARVGAPVEFRPFEERLPRRPFGLSSMPLHPYRPTRIIIYNMGRGMGPRLAPFEHQLTPRFLDQGNSPAPTEIDESKLSREEQEFVLNKLKKEIYNPVPKMLARRVSLYYRDLNRDLNNKAVDKHRDEEGKSCAVCLEDFQPREQVMVTPCKHIFHEECIVPWVKNHGQCPVCRHAFCKRMRENNPSLMNNSNNRGPTLPVDHQPFEGDLISLIQAVDEAFPWGA